VILVQPVHHGMVVESCFLDFGDSLCAEDAAAYCDEVLVGRSFGNQMDLEVLFEVSFFHREGFMSWVQKVIVGKGVDSNQGIMFNPFSECLVKGVTRLVWQLKNNTEFHIDLQFCTSASLGGKASFFEGFG